MVKAWRGLWSGVKLLKRRYPLGAKIPLFIYVEARNDWQSYEQCLHERTQRVYKTLFLRITECVGKITLQIWQSIYFIHCRLRQYVGDSIIFTKDRHYARNRSFQHYVKVVVVVADDAAANSSVKSVGPETLDEDEAAEG